MFFGLFKKKEEPRATELRLMHNNLEASFSKLKEEMDKVGMWIEHFNQKHKEHDQDKENLHKRVQSIERFLEQLNEYQRKNIQKQPIKKEFEEEIEEKPKESLIDLDPWEGLSQAQKNICYILSALNSENPDQWVSLKQLAQELYSSKKYDSVRSTMSEFTTLLEEMGYLKKKRRGKQTYVISTDKNPYLKEKKLEIKKIKAKNKNKEDKK